MEVAHLKSPLRRARVLDIDDKHAGEDWEHFHSEGDEQFDVVEELEALGVSDIMVQSCKMFLEVNGDKSELNGTLSPVCSPRWGTDLMQ